MEKIVKDTVTRRSFIKKSGIGIATTAMAMNTPFIISAPAAPDDPIKIGLVGCGGRGTGAALDAVNAATNVIYPDAGYHTEDAKAGAKASAKNVEIIAMADVFCLLVFDPASQMGVDQLRDSGILKELKAKIKSAKGVIFSSDVVIFISSLFYICTLK
jgi:hypothetical protein